MSTGNLIWLFSSVKQLVLMLLSEKILSAREVVFHIFWTNTVHTACDDTVSKNKKITQYTKVRYHLYPQVTERLPWYHDDESLGSPISPLHSPTMDHKDSTMVDSVIRNEVGYMARSMFILHSFSLFPVCLFSSWGQTSLLIWTLHAMLRPNVPSQPPAICSMLTTHIAWDE